MDDVHDKILHQVNYLGEALEVLEGMPRIYLVPVDL